MASWNQTILHAIASSNMQLTPTYLFVNRTKWKRQTAVGLELLAEAGNYAAFQRLYGGYWAGVPAYPAQPAPAAADLYYRQAAATAAAAASASANTLQKPLPYRWATLFNPALAWQTMRQPDLETYKHLITYIQK